MHDREKVIKELESLRDICNAKSNMAIGNGKVAWAGYANTADDAIAMLKEQEDLGTELTNAMELIHKKNERIKKLEEQIETLTKWRMNAGAFD